MKPCFLLVVSALVCLPVFTGTAQITYTDVNPDQTLCTPSTGGGGHTNYYADLNKDGKIDFQLSHFYAQADWVAAEAWVYDDGTQNYTRKILVNDQYLGEALSENDTIGPNTPGIWRDPNAMGGMTSVYLSNYNEAHYPWHNAVDKYLAVSMQIQGSIRYGWIRMDVAPNSANVVVKDFAIDMTPDRPILAGAKNTVSVDRLQSVSGEFQIYMRGKSLMVEAASDANIGAARGSEISVYNILGTKVASKPMESRYETISLQRLPAGSYLAVLRTGEHVQSTLVRVW